MRERERRINLVVDRPTGTENSLLGFFYGIIEVILL